MINITTVGFLNSDTPETSIGRLGLGTLPSGVSPLATVALVQLTCQAHGVRIGGQSRQYDEKLLEELTSIKLIFWRGGDTVQLV
jgi:hypothetical protein